MTDSPGHLELLSFREEGARLWTGRWATGGKARIKRVSYVLPKAKVTHETLREHVEVLPNKIRKNGVPASDSLSEAPSAPSREEGARLWTGRWASGKKLS